MLNYNKLRKLIFIFAAFLLLLLNLKYNLVDYSKPNLNITVFTITIQDVVYLIF